mmetsp:Transcript_102028/g.243287  ORF Transcript_102028/g.243287 Transcript_102028/m.243287 type:complete len:219 (+) Transcript_102028:1031-1687(+)
MCPVAWKSKPRNSGFEAVNPCFWHSSRKSCSERRPEPFLALSMAWKADSAPPKFVKVKDLNSASTSAPCMSSSWYETSPLLSLSNAFQRIRNSPGQQSCFTALASSYLWTLMPPWRSRCRRQAASRLPPHLRFRKALKFGSTCANICRSRIFTARTFMASFFISSFWRCSSLPTAIHFRLSGRTYSSPCSEIPDQRMCSLPPRQSNSLQRRTKSSSAR